MNKVRILALAAALLLLTACGGAGSGQSAEAAPTAAPTAEPTSAPTAEPTPEPTAEPTSDPNTVAWMGYTLQITDRQAMTGKNWPIQGASKSIDNLDIKSGGSYVMLQLSCADSINSSDLTDENVKRFLLTLPDGTEIRPFGYNWWGFGFSNENGFYNNETQEGFRLVFEIPEGADIEALRLSAD